RDEGEYAYVGQLILQGVPPYQLAYSMKFPGVYAGYALFMSMFGQTPAGIHIGLLLINLASAFVLLLLARKLLGFGGGCLAAATYLVLSINPSVLGLAAHATHFVVLPTLISLLLLWTAGPPPFRRVALAGLLFGIAGMMKQPGFAFAPLGLGLVIARYYANGWRRLFAAVVCFSS